MDDGRGPSGMAKLSERAIYSWGGMTSRARSGGFLGHGAKKGRCVDVLYQAAMEDECDQRTMKALQRTEKWVSKADDDSLGVLGVLGVVGIPSC